MFWQTVLLIWLSIDYLHCVFAHHLYPFPVMAFNESQVVSKFISDESINLSKGSLLPQTKRHRSNVVYKTQHTFSSFKEANQFVMDQQEWQFKCKSQSFEGIKMIYLCKYSSKCVARVCIWLPNHEKKAFVQSTDCAHDHAPQKLNGIKKETKE